MAEYKGKRRSQEDTLVYGTLNEKYANCDWQLALQATVDELHSGLPRQAAYYSGTCMCCCIVIGKRVITANLGDSAAFIIARSQNDVIAQQLNELHNPIAGSKEHILCVASGLSVINDRIRSKAGSLAISRALGDRSTLRKYTQAIDIDYQEHTATEQNSFAVVACDGLTEVKSIEEVAQSAFAEPTIATLADDLAKAGLESGSTDNISVLVTPIEADSTIKVMVIFDGHGGAKIAQYAAQLFEATLKKQLEAQLIT